MSNQLDYDTYRRLLIQYEKRSFKKGDEKARQSWFDQSLERFYGQELKTFDDLIRIIAFSYSWMPRIPRFYPEKVDQQELLQQLHALRENRLENRKQLVHDLVQLIDNSVVGASKVLHFIHPEIPILDSRVIVAWRALFRGTPELIIFPKTRIADSSKMIDKYLLYWVCMESWLKTCQEREKNLEMRNLERLLYSSGKS